MSGISTSGATPRISLIASGSGTANGNGANQDIFNIVVGSDIQDKTLIIEFQTEKILGGGATACGISNAAGSAASWTMSNATLNTTSYMKMELRKAPNTTTSVLLKLTTAVNCGSNITSTSPSYLTNEFDLSASETFYGILNAAAGNNIKYSYLAYLVG